MCTGRVDLSFMLRAFSKGADGVFIGGCWPGECHYVTEGNYDALGNSFLCKKLLTHIGVKPERLRIEWIAASEGSRFAELMTDFVRQVKGLGPIGQSEGLGDDVVRRKLGAALKLVPYLKLVERERLRAPVKNEKAYQEFFESRETERLFTSLVSDRLATSEIMALLADGPRSTGEIAEALGMSPSEVSRHMNGSSRQGWVQYDVQERRYALATAER